MAGFGITEGKPDVDRFGNPPELSTSAAGVRARVRSNDVGELLHGLARQGALLAEKCLQFIQHALLVLLELVDVCRHAHVRKQREVS
mgnify:CR=1 FL=1